MPEKPEEKMCKNCKHWEPILDKGVIGMCSNEKTMAWMFITDMDKIPTVGTGGCNYFEIKAV